MTVDVASKQFSDTVETFLKIFRTDYRFLVEAVHSLLTKNAVFWGGLYMTDGPFVYSNALQILMENVLRT